MSLRPSIGLAVRTVTIGSNSTDFHEFCCMGIFRKSVEKIQVLLKWEKNNGHFTRRAV
jgi:hypothetical protein